MAGQLFHLSCHSNFSGQVLCNSCVFNFFFFGNIFFEVTYAMEDRSKIDAKAKKASATMGTDFGNPETHKKVLAGAASDGERAVEVAKKDLEKLMVWWNKKEWTMAERFDPPPSKVGQIYWACQGINNTSTDT